VQSVPIWSDALSVGSYLIDRQNKRLILLCRQLVIHCSDYTQADLLSLLEQFENVARMHFETEETLLARNRCPTLASHKDQHVSYLGQLAELRKQNPIPIKQLNQLLGEKIIEHLMTTDMAVKTFLHDNRSWGMKRARVARVPELTSVDALRKHKSIDQDLFA
jgi:hemerythrin-like metal-binding protein